MSMARVLALVNLNLKCLFVYTAERLDLFTAWLALLECKFLSGNLPCVVGAFLLLE